MLRDVVIFFAGAEAFHTLSHLLIPYFFTLPLVVGSITLTSSLNNWAALINGIVTLALILIAAKMKRTT